MNNKSIPLQFDTIQDSPAATLRVRAPDGSTYVNEFRIDVERAVWTGRKNVDGTYEIDVDAGLTRVNGYVEPPSTEPAAGPRLASAVAISALRKGLRGEAIRAILKNVVEAQRLRHALVTDLQEAKANGDVTACASEEEIALLGELGTRLAVDTNIFRWLLPFVCGGDAAKEPREWMSQGQLDALALGVAEGNRDVSTESAEERRKAAQ